ncbi:MAG TPA: hypothetical protein VFU55_04755 [Terracidiphilus sp.]|nr:hypothetical protein [Terracidiphilus sp.]
MDKVVFLSGTTRGATLEGIGRSLARGFGDIGMECVEISLLDRENLLRRIRSIAFDQVRLVYSWVSMGMDLMMTGANGREFNLWRDLRVPFVSFHGDSPAYFFDRHIVPGANFVTLYGFDEHCALRRRLPARHGMVGTLDPIVLDEIPRESVDFAAKKEGTLLLLKNGKDPERLKRYWKTCLEGFLLEAMLEMAGFLEKHMDDGSCDQIDDVVLRYFHERDFEIEELLKTRLFFVAQLDDYIRAVKCTLMAEALMDFPVEIRGNEWEHVDFSRGRAKYIDECDYAKSIGLIRGSLGMIDMSPNTSSNAHDRVSRAYGSHSLCLTNRQRFLEGLPHAERFTFAFQKESIQERVADLLAHREEALEMGAETAAAYRERHPARQLVQRMLDCAALARLNQSTRRPAGSQDFFVWPPVKL